MREVDWVKNESINPIYMGGSAYQIHWILAMWECPLVWPEKLKSRFLHKMF